MNQRKTDTMLSLLYVKVKVTQSRLTLCNCMDHTLQARILQWVAVHFSRVSSQPRDWTQVSCIAGGFFTTWATREARNDQEGLWILISSVIQVSSQFHAVSCAHLNDWHSSCLNLPSLNHPFIPSPVLLPSVILSRYISLQMWLLFFTFAKVCFYVSSK